MHESDNNERREEILHVAADLFSSRGYKATSIRDVAAKVGILAGSLYHHIRSKETLFLEVHGLVLARDGRRLRDAVAKFDRPWDRLEALCIALATASLDSSTTAFNIMIDYEDMPDGMKNELHAQREAFYSLISDTIKEVDLDASVDRDMLVIFVKSVYHNLAKDGEFGGGQADEAGRKIFSIINRCRAS